MGKNIRWVAPNSLVEISCRCIQARFLLRPSPELNEIFLGVLIHALRDSGIRIHYIFVMSGHYHFLATVPSTGAMAKAMESLQTNLSKEIGRLHDWPGTLWSGPYKCQIVDDDEATQVARLEYLLAQSCAAGLTSKPEEWPGIHAVDALLEGRPLVGKWISRGSQWAARNRKGADSSDRAHSERMELTLDPLPCWAGLSEEERRERVAYILARIEETTLVRHAADGTRPAGRRKILAIDPHFRPDEAKSSPEPRVLARDPARRRRLLEAISAVVAAFREAAEELAEGNGLVRFPRGTFPPGLPYVPTVSDLLAGG